MRIKRKAYRILFRYLRLEASDHRSCVYKVVPFEPDLFTSNVRVVRAIDVFGGSGTGRQGNGNKSRPNAFEALSLHFFASLESFAVAINNYSPSGLRGGHILARSPVGLE